MSQGNDAIAELSRQWSRLAQALLQRHERGVAAAAEFEAATGTENERHGRTVAQIRDRRDDICRKAQDRFAGLERTAREAHAAERGGLQAKAQETEEEIQRRFERQHREARDAYRQALWLAESVHEAGENGPRIQLEERRAEVGERRAALEQLVEQARRQTRRYRQRPPQVPPAAPGEPSAQSLMQLSAAMLAAQQAYAGLRRQRVAGLFRGPILLVPTLMLAASAAVAALLAGARGSQLGLAALAGAMIVPVVAVPLWFMARGHVRHAWAPLLQAIAQAESAAAAALVFAEHDRERQVRQAKDQLDRDRQAAHARWKPVLAAIESKREARRQELGGKLPERTARIERSLQEALAEATAERDGLMTAAGVEADLALEREHARHRAEVDRIRQQHEDAQARRTQDWVRERDQFEAAMRDLMARGQAVHADLDSLEPDASVFPHHLFCGSVLLQARDLAHGLPEEAGHAWPGPATWQAPVLRPLPQSPSLLIQAPPERRGEALAALQAAVARLLLQSPPGKVRLTLIDPVGLGQSFAGFMHLADRMEQLVGERIWTEPRHIEQKLLDLTEHMETVIQKYLRDEYPTIADYNAEAGQLAEPLRVLVMADFPAGLNEAAVRRLLSVLQSGARCGVHLLVLRDASRALPDGLAEGDLLRACRRILWQDGAFRLDDPVLATAPLELDAPPSAARLQSLLQAVGERAKAASVVQVPFEAIAPGTAQVWTASSAESLRVPIGRTGATQLQNLVLGEGTRQHVLIAGKTGSGKSTLLNAMIVNLASWFSPEELELWLVDFKKGVEFKAYAMHGLPHARAVAVESDREFGLSVLQGLDAELKRRGDLFRSAGVQDLAAWRRLGKSQPMPRALLMVDEFQELFVEEDKVAQEAALLLDRLVRQGRAFGMHVILGSQTLGGAYALPRTTMGQMGVRVAMQCNEADAALILSDDNTAARLLSRPGEAIYNDAGGLVEGNSPFQVVWLGDHERERRVKELSQRGQATSGARPPMIVFDGTSRADISACRSLRARLAAPAAKAKALVLHLGEPVAIREATVAPLRRQSGANLLVVGQEEHMALGVSVSVLASLRGNQGVRVTLLDGTPGDSPDAGRLEAIARSLGLDVQVPSWRDIDQAIVAVGQEVARRQESGRADEPPLVLLLHGLQRFRSLRRDEDDFSFGSSDAPPKPDRVLASVLRDGPPLGVHVVAWADTASSLQRVVDRNGMREFDQRVLMQMGANDSSGLIDSPAASRLGAERALLFSEERGTVERFRPFEPASDSELAALVRAPAS